jgi:hypothetical protein
VQHDDGRDRGDNHRPEQNPSPPDCERNGIIEHIAIPPFCLARLYAGIAAPALEASWANVLRSQLQIAQRTYEPAAPLAASLKCLVGMKEACRLV